MSARAPARDLLRGVRVAPSILSADFGRLREQVAEVLAAGGMAAAIGVGLCKARNPGLGGQPFITHSLDKLPRVRAIVGHDVAVEVDGGIDPETAPPCRAAGANLFVAGSAIFTSGDPGD